MSRNAFMKTSCASRIASPDFGMMGENHKCPSVGDGLSAERAPIMNCDRCGMPIAGRPNQGYSSHA
jgi:hypothetical protein